MLAGSKCGLLVFDALPVESADEKGSAFAPPVLIWTVFNPDGETTVETLPEDTGVCCCHIELVVTEFDLL